jgi:hypothetical protein
MDEYMHHTFFAGPAIFLALMSFKVPIILNPWILGWPFLRKNNPRNQATNQQGEKSNNRTERSLALTSAKAVNDPTATSMMLDAVEQ